MNQPQVKMKTKPEHKKFRQKARSSEAGNALIYILIAIALFTALTFTMGRQSDTSEATTISDDKVELYATQLISYAAQVKSALDQMQFSGVAIDDMDFTLPNEAGFETEPPLNIYKVYHPSGGGIIPAQLPADAIYDPGSSNPGWYLGRFNDTEWSPSTENDVMLTARSISEQVCERINEIITGSTTIPPLTTTMNKMTLAPKFNAGTKDPYNSTTCPTCDEALSICVSNSAVSAYSFISIVALQ